MAVIPLYIHYPPEIQHLPGILSQVLIGIVCTSTLASCHGLYHCDGTIISLPLIKTSICCMLWPAGGRRLFSLNQHFALCTCIYQTLSTSRERPVSITAPLSYIHILPPKVFCSLAPYPHDALQARVIWTYSPDFHYIILARLSSMHLSRPKFCRASFWSAIVPSIIPAGAEQALTLSKY